MPANCNLIFPVLKRPYSIRAFVAVAFIFLFSGFGYAQKFSITLGNPKLGVNEIYSITLNAQDASLDDYGNFPNIPGFAKAGTSSSSSMRSFNGKVSQEYSIIQNYMPQKQGTFLLPPFSIKVNGQILKSAGAKIIVGPAVDNRNSDPYSSNPFGYDPFEDFFGKTKNQSEAKADAFFSIKSDKEEIWAGEGFTLTISFLVSDENQAELSFYDVGNQLTEIVRKIKPRNCWEENFGIEEIEQRKLKIGKKGYTEYRIYQSTLFPQSPGKIMVPAMKMNMMALASNGFFGARGKEEIRPFSSKAFSIKVKDLPDHPMKGNTAVGSFVLEEKPAKTKVVINQGIGYDFTVKGEGNISYIQEPSALKSGLMDIYPPNTQQNIQRAAGRVTGSKVFSYLLVPKEQGNAEIGKALFWVYFNVKTGQFDTLRPKTILNVVKGKTASARNSARSEDSFYSLIDKVDHKEVSLEERKSKNLIWYNIAIAVMALISIVLVFVKR